MNISVIIPSYNRATVLPRAVRSVLAQTTAQTTTPAEIVVVDDGSADNTQAILAEFENRITVLRQDNCGVSAARNLGIQHASGEWIALLDSDDEWAPDKLSQQITALQKQAEYKICHSDEIWIRNGQRVNPMKKHAKADGHCFTDCLPLCSISPSSVLIHRSVLDDVGLFDTELPACEDYDLWLRITAIYPVLLVPQPLVIKYGGHADQLSRQHWGMDRFRIRALQNILTGTSLNNENRSAAIAMLQQKLAILLAGARKHNNTALLEEYEPLLGALA